MSDVSLKTDNLIAAVADKANLKKALSAINPKGCPGIDGQRVWKLIDDFPLIADKISQALLDGTYEPDRVLRIYIPKNKQKTAFRMLSIPVVKDRMVQTAIVQVLNPIFEPAFCDESYGFIAHRGCFPALRHTLELANMGYSYVVNIDLRKFFDSVPHEPMMKILENTIKDQKVLDLIYKYLTARVKERGKPGYRDVRGIPQGGPLSPLLANIFLNELDNFLKSNGHQFSRYADDCIIMCRCEAEATIIFKDVLNFLNIMDVDINYEKSSITDLSEIEYLGYSFKYNRRYEYSLSVSGKKMNELKNTLYGIIQKHYSKVSDDIFVNRFCSVTRGWVNYYALADMEEQLIELDNWFADTINKFCKDRVSIYTKPMWTHTNNHELNEKDYSLDIIMDWLENKTPSTINNIDYKVYLKRLYGNGYVPMQEFYHRIRKKWNLE